LDCFAQAVLVLRRVSGRYAGEAVGPATTAAVAVDRLRLPV
jgi:hypothetical protein